jgi:hypothetical protein
MFLTRAGVVDIPGCSVTNYNPNPLALASELARIELTETTFLLLAAVLAILIWVGAQIGKVEQIQVEPQFEGKKKKGSGSSSSRSR